MIKILVCLLLVGCSVIDPITEPDQENNMITFPNVGSAEIIEWDYNPDNKNLCVKFVGNADLTKSIYLAIQNGSVWTLMEVTEYEGVRAEIKFNESLDYNPENVIVFWDHWYVG